MSADGHAGVDNLPHAPADAVDVGRGDGMVELQVHVVAVRHGDVDDHLGAAVQIMDSLAEHEEKRAGVVAQARARPHVEEFHRLVPVQTIVHALHLVVHLGTDGAVRHI